MVANTQYVANNYVPQSWLLNLSKVRGPSLVALANQRCLCGSRREWGQGFSSRWNVPKLVTLLCIRMSGSDVENSWGLLPILELTWSKLFTGTWRKIQVEIGQVRSMCIYINMYIYIDIYGMIESSKSTAIFSTARTEKTMWNNPSICKPRRYLLWGCGIIPISHFKTLVLWVGMNFRSWLNSGIFFLGMSPSWRPRILLRDAQHPMMKGHVLSLVA